MKSKALLSLGLAGFFFFGSTALTTPPLATLQELLGAAPTPSVEEEASVLAYREARESADRPTPAPKEPGGPESPVPLIIDTDPAIGYPFRDVDDGLALLMALDSPELKVIGITITSGNVDHHQAREAAGRLLDIADRRDVPVLLGTSGSGGREDVSEASEFMVRSSREFPGELVILALGALTNVAGAIETDPGFGGRVRDIISLGGVVVPSGSPAPRRPVDINFGADPNAVRRTIESDAPLSLVTVNRAKRFVLRSARYSSMVSDDAPYGSYLAAATRSWYLAHLGSFVVWDVVALGYLAHPEWFRTVEASLEVVEVGNRRGKVILSPREEATREITLPTAMPAEEEFWHWFDALLCEQKRAQPS